MIKRYIASATALIIVESSWKDIGKRCYLWTFVALRAVFFLISPSRDAKVLKEMLGDQFAGIITSDDHSAIIPTIKVVPGNSAGAISSES